jgi:predicted phosphodiesterase
MPIAHSSGRGLEGHTHVPMYVRVERGCVVNPGSLYTFSSVRPSSHSYGVLHLTDLSFDVYDVKNQRKIS